MSQPLHTVHVRVNDAATGQPTPVRIRFTDEKGTYYAPFGRLTEISSETGFEVGGNLVLDDKQFAYIDGMCEIELPAGRVFVEISKGLEYQSVSEDVLLAPGKMAIRLEIKRWSDLRQERWFPGDTMVAVMSPHPALLEAEAEDLAVVNLLAMHLPWRDKTWCAPNLLAFSGQQPALERSGSLVVVNTHNLHLTLGSVSLLNCHRVVYPLRFGKPFGSDNWTLADWCDQCHRKEGLVIWVPEQLGDYDEEYTTLHQGELPADMALGKVDALEFNWAWELNSEIVKEYYGFLKLGFHLPLVGGSHKMTNQELLGGWRTYARLQPGEEFNYKNWIEAVRAGRSFATKGALLLLTANGQDPGAVINLDSSDQTIHVKAGVRRAFPPDRLELIVNGKVVAESNSASVSQVEMNVPMPVGGWLAAAYWGCEDNQGSFKLLAHTSPIYVEVPGRRPPPDVDAGRKLLDHFDEMLEWVRTQARVENEDQRVRLARVFESAKEEVTKRIRK
jgi:hypothetical protein